MLMKWMWQWKKQDRQQAWWKEATIMTHPSDTPWTDPNATAFWKGIRHSQPQFDCSVTYRIGNGTTTKFWHNNWLGTVLKWKFSTLYHEATNKQASVRQGLNTDDWSPPSTPLTQAAQNEKNLLSLCLQDIPTPHNQLQDEIMWNRGTGPFTVSTAYRFISHTPSHTSSLHNLWQLKAPPRVAIFAWLMLTNRLTTVDNLKRRGWSLPNMCTMCGAQEETVPHLFTQCTLAQQIRAYMPNVLPLPTQLSSGFATTDSTLMLTDPAESTITKRVEIVMCFVIWRERCRRIFIGKTVSHMTLIREIKLEIQNWFPV